MWFVLPLRSGEESVFRVREQLFRVESRCGRTDEGRFLTGKERGEEGLARYIR